MFPQEWIKKDERVLSADQVKRLDPGTKVTEIWADRYGECCWAEYTVVQNGKKKVLCRRDDITWEKKVVPIRDSENRRYVIKKGAAR